MLLKLNFIALMSLWRVRTTMEVMKWKGAWPKEAIHAKLLRAGCGQEEPGQYVSEISNKKLP